MTVSRRSSPFSRDLRRWPHDPAQLVDTRFCPACFSFLTGPACSVCGLDLAVPAAAELLAAGTRVRDAETERQAVITRLRAAQAATAARPVPPSPVPTSVAPMPAPAAAAEPPTPTPAAAAVESAMPTAPSAPVATHVQAAAGGESAPAGPRRSGVQVLLLTLGVVLLSVAAIVFLLVAYLIATLEVRSVVIAVASVLVLALSWLLRARGLPGTAEGVAALAVVLLVLDVWIIRANDLFLSERLDTPGYWGGALLLLSALLGGARLVSRVRVPGIAAAVLAPIGLAAFAYGIPPRGETATGVWLGGGAVLLAGAAARFGGPSVERAILVWAGLAGGTVALVAAPWALDAVAWSPAWPLLGSAAGWLVMLVALRMRSIDAWPKAAPFAAAMAGIAAAAAPALGAAVELEAREALWIAPASAGAVACLAAAATRGRGRWARDGFSAFIASASVAALAAMPALFVATVVAVPLAEAPFRAWSLDALMPRENPITWVGDLRELVPGAVLAPFALGIAAAIALALLGRLRRLGAVPAGLLLTACVVASVTASTLLGTVGLLLAVAVAALGLAVPQATGRVPGAVVLLAVFGIGAAAVAWALAHGSADLWWWTVAAVLVLAVAGRLLARRVWSTGAAPVMGALHLVAASVIAAFAAFAAPAWADAAARPFPAPWDRGAFVVGLGCALVLAAVAFASRLHARDQAAIAIPLLAAGGLGGVAPAAAGAAPFAWVPAAALAVVGLLWLRSPITGLRVAFAATAPVMLGVAGWALVTEYGRADLAVHGVAGAALLAAGLAHVVLPQEARVRIAWSTAVGVVAVLALQSALLPTNPEQTWLALLILAPVPILIAALYGDPIAGDSPVRHLSWASPALVVGAVWARLAIDDVREVEAYTLPLAVALGASGALLMWRRATGAATATGRTAVLASAAAIAVLPSVAAAGGSELRTLVLVSAGSVAVLAGIFLPDRARGVPLRLLVVAAGWTAVTGAALVRGTAIAQGEPSAFIPEFWPLLALAVGVLAAVAWTRPDARPAAAAEWSLAASVALMSVPTLAAVLDGDLAELRAGLLFSALAAVHVAAVAVRARPIAGPVVGWTAVGVMALAGSSVLAAGAVDPFDLVTVPIGTALLAAGAIRMRRTPTLGSWPALAPGLVVLLVPALIADWSDPELWRIVALGVVAVAAVVVGVVFRLQAPVLLGGAVVLVHALTQLWPWISRLYEAVWWWLWLGLAGALLVVIAATYERQVRLARGAVRTIAALR
jgi:hypothetical protein